jgi:hypothetical protein
MYPLRAQQYGAGPKRVGSFGRTRQRRAQGLTAALPQRQGCTICKRTYTQRRSRSTHGVLNSTDGALPAAPETRSSRRRRRARARVQALLPRGPRAARVDARAAAGARRPNGTCSPSGQCGHERIAPVAPFCFERAPPASADVLWCRRRRRRRLDATQPRGGGGGGGGGERDRSRASVW